MRNQTIVNNVPSTNEGKTKLQGDGLQLKQTSFTTKCEIGDGGNTDIRLDDSLAGLKNPLKGVDSGLDGNYVIAQNLKTIAGYLLILADRIVETDESLDTPAIVGFYYMLPYYDKVLPKLLSQQLRAASRCLPIGLFDNEMFHHVFPDFATKQKQEKKG